MFCYWIMHLISVMENDITVNNNRHFRLLHYQQFESNMLSAVYHFIYANNIIGHIDLRKTKWVYICCSPQICSCYVKRCVFKNNGGSFFLLIDGISRKLLETVRLIVLLNFNILLQRDLRGNIGLSRYDRHHW